jgi:hypothetical protein
MTAKRKNIFKFLILLIVLTLLVTNGCIAPQRKTPPKTEEKDYEEELEEDLGIPDSMDFSSFINTDDKKLGNGDLIFKYAFKEQKKPMYARNSESVTLYWLKNKKLKLKGHTKCNIFAINTLYKAGFLCPSENARTKDLMNKKLFTDILPIINVSKPSQIKKGDLIVWNGHVIVYDTITYTGKRLYAKAIWAGTSKKDNGKNIINNVIYGKYPLTGNFIIRRPIKR